MEEIKEKPIVFYDLETTGLDLLEDRVVEIYLSKVERKLYWEVKETLHLYFNPGKKLSEENIAIHGLTNEFLADKPLFKDKAQEIADFIGDSDIGGYNNRCYDDIILGEEFERAGVKFSFDGRNNMDVMKTWFHFEPRNLAGPYKRFTGKVLDDAHKADNDVNGTIAVFNNLGVIDDIKGKSIKELCEATYDPNGIDPDGKFVRREDGEVQMMFGKYHPDDKNKTLSQAMKDDRQYLDWIINKSQMSSSVKYYLGKLMK